MQSAQLIKELIKFIIDLVGAFLFFLLPYKEAASMPRCVRAINSFQTQAAFNLILFNKDRMNEWMNSERQTELRYQFSFLPIQERKKRMPAAINPFI